METPTDTRNTITLLYRDSFQQQNTFFPQCQLYWLYISANGELEPACHAHSMFALKVMIPTLDFKI